MPNSPSAIVGNNHFDVDIHPDGRILVGHRFGDVVMTDRNFSSASVFNTGNSPTFVAFTNVPATIPEPTTGLMGLLIGGMFVRRRAK